MSRLSIGALDVVFLRMSSASLDSALRMLTWTESMHYLYDSLQQQGCVLLLELLTLFEKASYYSKRFASSLSGADVSPVWSLHVYTTTFCDPLPRENCPFAKKNSKRSRGS